MLLNTHVSPKIHYGDDQGRKTCRRGDSRINIVTCGSADSSVHVGSIGEIGRSQDRKSRIRPPDWLGHATIGRYVTWIKSLDDNRVFAAYLASALNEAIAQGALFCNMLKDRRS